MSKFVGPPCCISPSCDHYCPRYNCALLHLLRQVSLAVRASPLVPTQHRCPPALRSSSPASARWVCLRIEEALMSLFIRVLVLFTLLVSPQAFAKNSGSSGSRVVTATSKTNTSKVINTTSPNVRSTISSKKSNSQQIRSNADEKGAQNSDEQRKIPPTIAGL